MAQIAPAEMFSPTSPHVWQGLIDWLTFLYQVIAQIPRAAPSIAQILSYVGLRRPLLASSSPTFKPLPVIELPLHQSSELTENSSCVAADAGGAFGCASRPLERLTVVLDLDETLVCAYEKSSLPATVLTQATESGLNWFELECVYSDKESEGKPKISYVIVFERPGLRQFLRQTNEFADLVLFTAGVEGYAKPLVDRIDPENRFSLRLYRPSTVSTAHREHVKDLSCLSKDLRRVVIVDNNPFSFLLQPLNGIPCVPFTAAQLCDDQLLEVLLPLLKELSLQEDVRPVLRDKFRMQEWFNAHGFPVSG